MDNLNPEFEQFKIEVDKLCGPDGHSPFKVECWDWEKSGKNQFIGEVEITLQDLNSGKKNYPLKNPKKSNPGTLILSHMTQINEGTTFIDYIRGNDQVNVMLAIDFTGSNKDPDFKDSLHHISKDKFNPYQQCINAVCPILLSYDWDKRIPVFGFGAKTKFPNLKENHVSHCFPCTGDPNEYYVNGLEGIMNAYNFTVQNTEFSGPTYFAPFVQKVVELSKQTKEKGGVYNVLIIMTDGIIDDLDKTKDLIVSADELPLSIVIVGIGNADFNKMVILDGDNGLSNTKKEKAKRDLVQFVKFNSVLGDPAKISEAILAELPQQFVAYQNLINRKPNPYVYVDMSQQEKADIRAMFGAAKNSKIFEGTDY